MGRPRRFKILVKSLRSGGVSIRQSFKLGALFDLPQMQSYTIGIGVILGSLCTG